MVDIIEHFKSQGIPPRTVQLLVLIYPFPVGEALKITEAAEKLGIKVNTAYQRLRELKKTCPLAYEKLREARHDQSVIGQYLHRRAMMSDTKQKIYLKPKLQHIVTENCCISEKEKSIMNPKEKRKSDIIEGLIKPTKEEAEALDREFFEEFREKSEQGNPPEHTQSVSNSDLTIHRYHLLNEE